MRIHSLLFILPLLNFYEGINGDKTAAELKRVEFTKELFPDLASSKLPPPTDEDFQAFIKGAEEERQELLKTFKSEEKEALEATLKLAKQEDSKKSPETMPKAPSLLRRRSPIKLRKRGRLVRRNYSVDPPYLKPDMELKDPSSGDVYKPLKRITSGSFGNIYTGIRKQKGVADTQIILKVCPLYWHKNYSPSKKKHEISDLALALKNEYKVLTELYASDNNRASKFIVKPFALIEHNEVIVMAMEEATLGSLDDYVFHNPGNSRRYARDIISNIIQGVYLMNSLNYAHRDLKPGNIFLRNNAGNPYAIVGDLGSATPLKNLNGNPVGTALYSAPEYWTNTGSINLQRADAFSVGAILYFIIAPGNPERPKIAIPSGTGFGPIDFDKKKMEQDRFDYLATDLMQRLCWPYPDKRMTSFEALQHPFINPALSVQDYFAKNPIPVDPKGIVKFVVISHGTLASRDRGPLARPNFLSNAAPQGGSPIVSSTPQATGPGNGQGGGYTITSPSVTTTTTHAIAGTGSSTSSSTIPSTGSGGLPSVGVTTPPVTSSGGATPPTNPSAPLSTNLIGTTTTTTTSQGSDNSKPGPSPPNSS